MVRHPLTSPNEGRVVDHWPVASDHEIADALARLARSGPSLAADPALRRKKLQAILAGVESARGDFVRLMVIEVAKTLGEAEGEVDYAISFLRHALDLLRDYGFEHMPHPGRRIIEVPYGPALLITPFNDPLAGIVRKLAPAIAAGSPVLIKPSPMGAATALRLGRVIDDVGAGDVGVVVAATEIETVRKLVADRNIGMVSFTGSTPAGLAVAAAAAAASKHCVTELGGNNPFIIFADADLDLAVDDFFRRKLRAAGQACSSVNRLFAHRAVFGEVRDRIAHRLARLKLDRSDANPDLGPVISASSVARLTTLAQAAIASGGRTVAPLRDLPGGGAFLFPLMMIETDAPGPLDEHESFGPLAALCAFDDPQALIARLAGERHMLAAYGYSTAPDAILPLLQQLPAGSIGVNSTAIQGPEFPTGGFGLSGRGREGGVWGFREFLTTRNIVQK